MIIDLRSDTVTKPSKAMLAALAAAAVGDDVYGEDPSTNELQDYVANLFDKEAALFVPSGTMSNQLALKLHTVPGDEVIVEKDAHIFFFEAGAPSIISNVQMHTIPSAIGEMPITYIEDAIRPDVYFFPQTKLICLENTHNRHGGTVVSLEYIESLRSLAKQYHIAMHLDGARIWNAAVATGIKVSQWAAHFDTVSVCLSKGLGAPVGSLLVGSAEHITLARKWRKLLGGGMRQAGLLAGAGLYALQHNVERLYEDHDHAKLFAREAAALDGLTVDLELVHTNMVAMTTTDIPAMELVSRCKAAGLLFNPIGKNRVRIVFHLDIGRKETLKAVDILKTVMRQIERGK